MSEQEKYDELIRQKFAEKEFIFNEENWEKAEHMLDSAKRSKKILSWGLIFLIGVFTGSSIMFFITKDGQHSVKVDPHAVLKTTQHTEEITTPVNGKAQTSAPVKDQELTTSQKINTSSVKNEESVAVDEVTEEQVSLSSHSLKTENATSIHSSESEAPVNTKTNKNNFVASRVKKSRNSSEIPVQQQEQPDVVNSNAVIAGKEFKQPTAVSGKEYTKHTNKKIKDKVSGKQAETSEIKEVANPLALNKVTQKSSTVKPIKEVKNNASEQVKEETGKNIKSEGTEPADSSGLESITASNNLNVTETAKKPPGALSDSVKQEEIVLVTADSTLPKVDSAIAKETVVAPSLPIDGLATTTIFSVDAGLHAQLGWHYSDTIEGRGITPIAGIGITHYFNQKWSASTGVQYGCIAYLKASTKNMTSTAYSFGAVTTSTTVKPGILNYLNIPLTLQYHFNDANALLFGGTYGLLLNKKSEVQIQTSYVKPDNTNPTSKTYYKNYYKQSFNNFDASLCVGYRRKISSHFNLTAIVNYGLSDVKKNKFFARNVVERDSGIKLILSYNIFDF